MVKMCRILSYVLFFILPVFVLVTEFNTDSLKFIFPAKEGEVFKFYFRLLYLPAKYFLWGLSLTLMSVMVFFHRRKFEWKMPHLFLILFWGWMLGSFGWTISHPQTLESFTQWSLIFGTMLMVSYLYQEQKHYKSALMASLLGLFVAVIISLVEQHSHLLGIYQPLGFRNASTFGNYKFIIHYGAIALPLFIPLFIWAKSLREKIALTTMLSLFVILFLVSGMGSKGMWLALVFDAVFLILYSFRHIPHYKKVVSGVACAAIAGAIFVGYQSYQGISPEKAGSTVQQRWIMWRNTLEAVAERPSTGTGLGTFPISYSKYEDPNDRKLYPVDESKGWVYFTRQAHNDILQVVQELGVVGFVLFSLLILALLWVGFGKIVEFQHSKNRWFAVALVLALCNFLILAFVYFPFHQPMSAILFSLIAGIIMGWRPSGQGNRQSALLLRANPVLSLGMLLFIPFIAWMSFKYFVSEWHWQRAHFKVGDNVAANNEVQKSLKWNDSDWEKLWSVGLFYLRQENFQKAKEMFAKAHELNPYMPHLIYNLGLTEVNLGNMSQALTLFNKALKMAPDYTLSLHQIGRIFYERQNLKKALKFFRRAQNVPHYMVDRSYYMAGLCEARLRRFHLAQKEIMEAIALRPKHLLYHQVLGMIMDRRKSSLETVKRDFPLQTLRDQLKSDKTQVLIQALRQAQYAKGAGQLLSQVFPLLKHKHQRVRMEATQYLLTLPQTDLIPLMKLYSSLKSDEVKWRVFYTISERLPNKATMEAKRLYHEKVQETQKLKILAMRHLSRHSPHDLVLPSPIGKGDEHIIRYYSKN